MAGIVIRTDIVAPNSLFEAGVTGRQIRRNKRAENQAGFVNVNVLWSNTRREFTWGTVPQTIETWQTLEGLWEVTEAGAYGFLLQDPKDPSADHTTGKVTLISGTTYQLVKRWTAAGSSPAATKDRTIKYVRATGFELKVAGVVQTLGSQYTLSAFTGVVTIAAAPTASTVTWSGIPYVPVHFRDDEIEWELVVAGPELMRRVVGPRVVLQEVKK